MIKAVIFDMDGVIINSEATWIKVVEDIFTEYGYEYTKYFHKKIFGSNAARVMKQNLDIKDSEAEIGRKIVKRFVYIIKNEGVKEVLGIYQLLDQVNKKFVLAIASSTPKAAIELILKKLGIRDYFSVIISGYQVKNPKPYPDIYLAVAEKLKLKPKECIAIEDSPNGVKSAKNAGMKCIALKNKYTDEKELKQAGADILVSSLDEITDKLLKKFS
jgi:HAD superfamily hydrolase (TIGR01509 family)